MLEPYPPYERSIDESSNYSRIIMSDNEVFGRRDE